MSQPLLATGRLVMKITTSSLLHTLHAYVRNVQAVGGSWNVNSRTTDANDVVWSTAAQGWWDAISYMLTTGQAAPSIELQQLVSGVWQVLASMTPTGGNLGAGGPVLGAQFTSVFRDTAYKPVKQIVFEGRWQPPFHNTSIAAFGSYITSYLTQFTSSATVTHPPYEWLASRGNRFLATTPFVGGTATFNRKVRRARGLA